MKQLTLILILVALAACSNQTQKSKPGTRGTEPSKASPLTREQLIGIWVGKHEKKIIIYCFREENFGLKAEVSKSGEIGGQGFFTWEVKNGHLWARQNADDPPAPSFSDFGGKFADGELYLSEPMLFGGKQFKQIRSEAPPGYYLDDAYKAGLEKDIKKAMGMSD